jgi:hypothetical protein
VAGRFGMAFAVISARTGQQLRETLNEVVLAIARAKVTEMPLQDVYLSFLLQLNEDFDDDLLQEAVALLT